MSGQNGRRETNTSVNQVFDVLHLMSRSGRPVTTAEVASRLGLSASTAHRVLATLEEAGYASRTGRSAERVLGIRAHELADALFNRFSVRGVSLPFLRELAAASSETSALHVRLGWYSMRIAGVEGLRDIHRTLGIGEIRPLHSSAGARTLLAGLSDGDVERYVAKQEAALRPALRAAIEEVRTRGYIVADNPDLPRGGRSLAFPLKGPYGGLVASVTVEGDPSQFDPTQAQIRRWRALVGAFEAELGRRPDITDPFAHVDPDSIDLGDLSDVLPEGGGHVPSAHA